MKTINKIIWVNFLHIYQPPWQSVGMLQKIAIESYDYLLTLLEKYPHFTFSLSITGDLIEQLDVLRPDLLKRLQKLAKSGRVEIVACAKYHPVLPLVPASEVKLQIKLNQETLKHYFDIKKIKGFYLPEMAYSDSVAKIVKNMGFDWLILDPICFDGPLESNILYQAKNYGLKIIFRDRQVSKGYPPEIIFHKLTKLKKSETIITATDGEMYGHQHDDWQGHIEKILQNKNLQVLTVGQYLNNLKIKKEINLRPASWESSTIELKNKIPYALWCNPKNKIHQSMWQLVAATFKLVDKYQKDKNLSVARHHLDRGLSSCSFWWASGQKPSAFSPVTWNPDMIEAGVLEIVRSVRALDRPEPKEKIKIEKIYLKILAAIWTTHWQKYHQKYD